MPALAERRPGRWADLGIRTLSALALAPVAVACVWVGGVPFNILVAAAMLGLAIEWRNLWRQARTTANHPLPLRAWAAKRTKGGVRASAGRSAPSLLLLLLPVVLLAGAALLWLRADSAAGRANVLILLLVVWAGDIGAYVVGRCVGGPRMAPRISPGKTWSGAVGGLLAAVAAGLVAAHLLNDTATWRAALVAAGLAIVAQAGDLLESYVKRRLEVKDSSHLIPGHGGLFDRLDGLLAAAPVAALLALTLGRGVVLWQ